MKRELNPNTIYKVSWYDIAGFAHESLNKDYKEYLAKCTTIGYVKEKDDVILVIYGDNNDGQLSGDAIPKACVYKIEKLAT